MLTSNREQYLLEFRVLVSLRKLVINNFLSIFLNTPKNIPFTVGKARNFLNYKEKGNEKWMMKRKLRSWKARKRRELEDAKGWEFKNEPKRRRWFLAEVAFFAALFGRIWKQCIAHAVCQALFVIPSFLFYHDYVRRRFTVTVLRRTTIRLDRQPFTDEPSTFFFLLLFIL